MVELQSLRISRNKVLVLTVFVLVLAIALLATSCQQAAPTPTPGAPSITWQGPEGGEITGVNAYIKDSDLGKVAWVDSTIKNTGTVTKTFEVAVKAGDEPEAAEQIKVGPGKEGKSSIMTTAKEPLPKSIKVKVVAK